MYLYVLLSSGGSSGRDGHGAGQIVTSGEIKFVEEHTQYTHGYTAVTTSLESDQMVLQFMKNH